MSKSNGTNNCKSEIVGIRPKDIVAMYQSGDKIQRKRALKILNASATFHNRIDYTVNRLHGYYGCVELKNIYDSEMKADLLSQAYMGAIDGLERADIDQIKCCDFSSFTRFLLVDMKHACIEYISNRTSRMYGIAPSHIPMLVKFKKAHPTQMSKPIFEYSVEEVMEVLKVSKKVAVQLQEEFKHVVQIGHDERNIFQTAPIMSNLDAVEESTSADSLANKVDFILSCWPDEKERAFFRTWLEDGIKVAREEFPEFQENNLAERLKNCQQRTAITIITEQMNQDDAKKYALKAYGRIHKKLSQESTVKIPFDIEKSLFKNIVDTLYPEYGRKVKTAICYIMEHPDNMYDSFMIMSLTGLSRTTVYKAQKALEMQKFTTKETA